MCGGARTAGAHCAKIVSNQEKIMTPTEQAITQSTFRNFVIEACAVQTGSQWLPRFRVSRGSRKTSWCTPRAGIFANSTLAIDAGVQHAMREIRRGWGSCFA
jgi:hypothetical protein